MGSAEVNLGDIFEDKKRIKNPFVPIGALMTAGVLTAGLMSFRNGNSQLSQKLMRARVIVQGGTVALMIGSAYYYGEDTFNLAKKSTKEALDSIEKAVEHSLASTGHATRGF